MNIAHLIRLAVFCLTTICLTTSPPVRILAQESAPASNDRQADLSELRSKLQAGLNQIVDEADWPGATAAVVLPDGRAIELAAGVSDREAPIEMPIGGRMLVGSTGKMLVSTVALQLVAEGRLELDERVSKYLKSESWFSQLPNAADLTIRSLLNHTSGLPRYVFQKEFLQSLQSDPGRQWTVEQRLALISDLEPRHPVGQGWDYSDTNYIVLGSVLEQVTGKSFYQLAQQRLIEPLNLENTLPAESADLPGLVQGYFGPRNPFGLAGSTVVDGRYAINPQFEWCGGGFLSNTTDLARLAMRIHAGELIEPRLYEQLVAPVEHPTPLPGRAGYGLGTFIWETDFGRFYGHAGIMPGYLTQVEYSASHGFAIALQCNTDADLGRHHHRQVQKFAREVEQFLVADRPAKQ